MELWQSFVCPYQSGICASLPFFCWWHSRVISAGKANSGLVFDSGQIFSHDWSSNPGDTWMQVVGMLRLEAHFWAITKVQTPQMCLQGWFGGSISFPAAIKGQSNTKLNPFTGIALPLVDLWDFWSSSGSFPVKYRWSFLPFSKPWSLGNSVILWSQFFYSGICCQSASEWSLASASCSRKFQ